MVDYAVIGGGIGGSAAAAWLHHHTYQTLLLEKEPYLGGSSSTFAHKGYRYNAGATTFAGYQDGHPVKQFFDTVGATPNLIKTDPSLVVIQGKHRIPRYQAFAPFLEAINRAHYHPGNGAFWELVYQINEQFYGYSGHYYSNASWPAKIRSLMSYFPLAMAFRRYLTTNAQTTIKQMLPGISEAYLTFIDAQILIVAQATSNEVNFLTAALALGYTFNSNHYVIGGMGALFDALTATLPLVEKRAAVTSIKRQHDRYLIQTANDAYEAKNIVLNSTIYDQHRLFDDAAMQPMFKRYAALDNHQSAFVVYLTLKTAKAFEHHYQIIHTHRFANTLSSALFVSFSDATDHTLTPEGHYSVTASIHTDARWWSRADRTAYQQQKETLERELTQLICDTLEIDTEEIVQQFSGSPETFRRYIGRAQLGGNAMTMRNLFFNLPSNDTPIKGLYQVGDSVYPGQGWPGVIMGVQNFARLIRE
jgi:phytoene dehydrogenase-like protein